MHPELLFGNFRFLVYRTPLSTSLRKLTIREHGHFLAESDCLLLGKGIRTCASLEEFNVCFKKSRDHRQIAGLLSTLCFELKEPDEMNLVYLTLDTDISCRLLTAFVQKNMRRLKRLFVRCTIKYASCSKNLASEIARQSLITWFQSSSLFFYEFPVEFKSYLRDCEVLGEYCPR